VPRRAIRDRRSIRRLAAGAALAMSLVACRGETVPSPAPTRTTPAASPSSASTATPGASTPSPFDPTAVSIRLEKVASVAGGPLAFAAPADGTDRMFIAAKDGRVWILAGGAPKPDPMLDIRALVSGGSEQGLLGIAVGPNFPTDPRVFVDYTDVGGNTVVASYALAGDNPDRLEPTSAVWILTVDQPYANHNGGALAFGPDGMLYVALGDGGSGGDPLGNGQRTDTLLGKLLRLDVRQRSGASAPYVIPPDNPFLSTAGARPEIWEYGLRNPWRFSFDPPTGDLWIGDVGQDAWEEVDVARIGMGGLNFGWNTMEGRHCFSPKAGCSTTGITQPVAEYDHDAGCTVIGGAVYRGTAQPLLAGGYLFADYCSGTLWAIPATTDGSVAPVQVGTTGSGIAAFGQDAEGEMYAANLDGTISRLVATAR
jgi:glucose/arabinose dehydrogenase